MERQIQPGEADHLVAIEPWTFPRSIVRALRWARSQVSRAHRERRGSRWPFIVVVLRDSGLMTDLPEEGEGGHLQRRNCETFPGTNNTPKQEHQS